MADTNETHDTSAPSDPNPCDVWRRCVDVSRYSELYKNIYRELFLFITKHQNELNSCFEYQEVLQSLLVGDPDLSVTLVGTIIRELPYLIEISETIIGCGYDESMECPRPSVRGNIYTRPTHHRKPDY